MRSYMLWEQEVVSSNLAAPTTFLGSSAFCCCRKAAICAILVAFVTVPTVTLTKSMKGLYRRGAIWWFGFTPAPRARRIQLSLGTSDESAAILEARRILSQAAQSHSHAIATGAAGQADLGRLRDQYLAHRQAEHISQRTVEQLTLVLRAFCAATLPKGDLSGLTRHRVAEWFADRKALNPRTAAAYLRIVRRWLDWCRSAGHLRNNPADGLVAPKTRPRIRRRFLTAPQSRQLLSLAAELDASGELSFICFCALHAGLRKGEIIEARPEWFDLSSGLLHVQHTPTFVVKDRDNRTIPLTDTFLAFLRSWSMPGPFCIAPTVKHGKHRYRYDFNRKWKTLLKAYQAHDLTFHDLRRTFASLLVSAGTSIYKVAKWMGDSVAVVEERYGHLIPKDTDINKAWE